MLVSEFRETPIIINIEMKGVNHRFINGKVRNRKYSAGYCNCNLHRGCLDDQQIVQHACFEKECPHFFKIIDDYYHERKTAHKKAAKEEKQLIIEEMQIVKKCNSLVDDNDGLRITSARKWNKNIWVLEYITICSVDLTRVEQRITNAIGAVKMVKKECDFDTSMRLFLAN